MWNPLQISPHSLYHVHVWDAWLSFLCLTLDSFYLYKFCLLREQGNKFNKMTFFNLSSSSTSVSRSFQTQESFFIYFISVILQTHVENGRRRRSVASDRDWFGDDVLVRGSVATWSSRDHSQRSGQQDDTVLCCLHWQRAFGRWCSQEPGRQESHKLCFW